MKAAKDFISQFNKGSSRRPSGSAKEFNNKGFNPSMRTPLMSNPTVTAQPLSGRFKGSNTSGEYPRKMANPKFTKMLTKRDYTNRHSIAKTFKKVP